MRGLSPPTFQSGGARAPPAPPISPPMPMYMSSAFTAVRISSISSSIAIQLNYLRNNSLEV